jgi:tetratricopeptide (TPR) repeat protein
MLRTGLILLLLSAGCFGSVAQIRGVDSLYKPEFMLFHTTLERSGFIDYFAGKPDYLSMIAAIDPETNERELGLYRNWIDEVVASIQEKKYEKLKPEKKIDRVQKMVSGAFLLEFKSDAHFKDLFTHGRYNYFTAAAVYGFVLDRLGIAYQIIETPSLLYLLTYPGEENIRLETGQPGFQFYMFDHGTRESFVDFMHQNGIIDDRTHGSSSPRELFTRYYFADYPLGIREIIGMMYLNSAVEMMIRERPHDSYAQLEKAFILYPSYKSQYLLIAQLDGHLQDMDYRNPIHLGYLIKASKLIGYGVKPELIRSFLRDIIQTILIEEEDREGFDYIYDYLQKYLTNEDYREFLTFHTLYQSGRMEFEEGMYARALDYLEPAHELRPEDAQTRNLLVRSLGGYSILVSAPMILDKIEHYDSSYTSILEEEIYLMVKLQTCLLLFGEAYQLMNSERGDRYMHEFEELKDAYPEVEVDQIDIGRSYSSAAIYYYRQGQVRRSRQIIEKGLSYAPGNIELKLKLAAFE